MRARNQSQIFQKKQRMFFNHCAISVAQRDRIGSTLKWSGSLHWYVKIHCNALLPGASSSSQMLSLECVLRHEDVKYLLRGIKRVFHVSMLLLLNTGLSPFLTSILQQEKTETTTITKYHCQYNLETRNLTHTNLLHKTNPSKFFCMEK